MKAKRLTALALAALMAASTMSVALAGEKVSNDLDFANDGYYKYNSDTNRLESAAKDEFQPGDDVYIRLVEDPYDAFSSKKTYNAYGSWAIGESWVKDIDVVYRKGDVIKTTTYDWKFTFDGTAYSGTGAAKNDETTKQSLIDQTLTDAVKNSYKAKYWDQVTGYNIDGYLFANAAAAAEKLGYHYVAPSGNIYSYGSKTGTLQKLGLVEIPDTGYVYGSTYDSTTDPVQVLKSLAVTGSPDNRFTAAEVYIDNQDAVCGEVVLNPTDPQTQPKDTVYTVRVNRPEGEKVYWWTEGNAEALLLNKLGIQKASTVDGYYDTTDSNKVVRKDQVVLQGNSGWTKDDATFYSTPEQALTAEGKSSGTHYVAKGQTNNTPIVDVDSKLNEAIAAAKSTFAFTAKTSTEAQYDYWVKISTKDSATTKDIDVVGTISVGTSKSSAEKEDELSVDFTLTNANTENGGYFDDVDSDITIEDGERAVVSFSDDAEDLIIEFGDDAWFEFNARGQGKLNLAYNTKYNREFAYDYDDANIDFINFEGEPTTNRTGTLYIYADEDSYIYEVTSKGAKKINGAYYDDDEEAWVIRTRNLTSYAISDKKLKTVDQMNNGSSSSSGSNSGSNSGSGSNNGKPNPDTGR